MSDAVAPEEPKRRPRAGGCLLRLAIAAAILTAVVVAIGFIFDQGKPSPSADYDAGPAQEYQAGVVIPIEAEHIFVARLPDGSFVAVYDKSPRQQELRGDCRVHYDTTSALGSVPQLPGFTGAFVEDCAADARTVWLADGTFAFGAGYGNLDRFDTHVDTNGELIIDTSARSCTTSRGVIGVPPFDVHRCGSGT